MTEFFVPSRATATRPAGRMRSRAGTWKIRTSRHGWGAGPYTSPIKNHEDLDELERSDPDGYDHVLNLQAGRAAADAPVLSACARAGRVG